MSSENRIEDLTPLEERRGLFDLICFPIISWHFRFQRPQQLASQFANAGHRVFYLTTHFHQASSKVHLRTIAKGIYEVQLPGLAPLSIYQGDLQESTLELWVHAFDEFIRRANIEDAVGLVQLPFWTPLALAGRALWGWRIIYDCLDDHAAFGNLSDDVIRNEAWLTKESDLVLASSDLLYEKLSHRAARVVLLRNASDFNHFNHPPSERPLAALPRPVIGYYGALSHWFRESLIRRAAEARPEWQFVLIGHVERKGITRLARLPNVRLLGEKSYVELPAYLHEFDVALIPFRRTPLTEATNPVKFYEYLSAGKPVVAVALPELEPYERLFYPVRKATEFIPQIEAALGERAPHAIQARIELARAQTWEERFTVLMEQIATL
jgi:glycosyltransferase involved in cell wall biosynthesis